MKYSHGADISIDKLQQSFSSNLKIKDIKFILKKACKSQSPGLRDDGGLRPPGELPQLADLEPELHHRSEHLPGRPGDLVLVPAVAVHVHPYSGAARTGSWRELCF